VVNNVETLCAIVKVMLRGGEWYKNLGTVESTGTKLLSISGDCRFPGIYEIEWGFSINDILDMVGADNVQAVQVGGPSGGCVPEKLSDTLSLYKLTQSLTVFALLRPPFPYLLYYLFDIVVRRLTLHEWNGQH